MNSRMIKIAENWINKMGLNAFDRKEATNIRIPKYIQGNEKERILSAINYARKHKILNKRKNQVFITDKKRDYLKKLVNRILNYKIGEKSFTIRNRSPFKKKVEYLIKTGWMPKKVEGIESGEWKKSL
jgi:hypothetical protein